MCDTQLEFFACPYPSISVTTDRARARISLSHGEGSEMATGRRSTDLI